MVEELDRAVSMIHLATRLAAWLPWTALVAAVIAAGVAGWFARDLGIALRGRGGWRKLLTIDPRHADWDRLTPRAAVGGRLTPERKSKCDERLAQTAQRDACLAVLGRALLNARYALRADHVPYDERVREVEDLVDAVHNLPEAARGNEVFGERYVSETLASYDARRALGVYREHLWPIRVEKLEELYRAELKASFSLQSSSELRLA
jgi:hypothetical protein